MRRIIMKMSPKYTTEDWNKLEFTRKDWNAAAKIFEDRINGRFLSQIDKIKGMELNM